MLAGLVATIALAGADTPGSFDAARALRARHAELRGRLSRNEFGRALYLVSAELPGALKGDVFAVVGSPFARSAAALTTPGAWCDILILHVNIKYCRPRSEQEGSTLKVHMGRKFPQSLEDTYRVEFGYADDAPVYIRGVRGVVERNTMRYYLAIEAYLDSLTEPLSRQLDSRLRNWFASTERYPRQLADGDLGSYLEMKQGEYRRQQADR
jgi:hypothetical protein